MSSECENELVISSPYPPQHIPSVTIGEYFVTTLSQSPNKIVVYDAKTGETLTAIQLIEKSHSIAVALLNQGVAKSDIIIFFSENLIEYAITQFAVYLLGNTFTFSNQNNGVYELSAQIKHSRANVVITSIKNASITDKVITDTDIRNQIKFCVALDGKHSDYISFNDLLEYGSGKALERVPHFQIDVKNDICMIGYTSGTTGIPKGALFTHYAFLAVIINPGFIVTDNKTESNVYGCQLPLSHMSGTLFFPKYLFAGFAVVLIDFNVFDDIFNAISKYKITAITCYPSFGLKLLDNEVTNKYDLSSLKYLHSGGTPFPSHFVQPIIEKFKLKSFLHNYGLTECVPITSLPTDKVYIPASNGRLAPNVELKVRDTNTGKSLGHNQSGEFCVRAPHMFKEYLNNPKATNETIGPNGWLYTGDIGYYDENERIFITDRIKELIKYSSYSIAPAEIEQFLLTHHAIEDAVIVGVPHPIDNQWLRAYVAVKSGKQLTENEVLKYVSDNMGSRKQLRSGVVFVDKIVKTLIGKIDRKYYRELVSKNR